jgi:hypothetical protein
MGMTSAESTILFSGCGNALQYKGIQHIKRILNYSGGVPLLFVNVF